MRSTGTTIDMPEQKEGSYRWKLPLSSPTSAIGGSQFAYSGEPIPAARESGETWPEEFTIGEGEGNSSQQVQWLRASLLADRSETSADSGDVSLTDDALLESIRLSDRFLAFCWGGRQRVTGYATETGGAVVDFDAGGYRRVSIHVPANGYRATIHRIDHDESHWQYLEPSEIFTLALAAAWLCARAETAFELLPEAY